MTDRNNQETTSAIDVIPNEARVRCVRAILVLAAAYAVLRAFGFHRLFPDDAEGIGAILQIVGTLYSVLYAFAIYVIWGQFTAVESQIQQEAGALKDLLLFSHRLKEAVRDPIVRALRNYGRAVLETEWSALSSGATTERTDRAFSDVVASVTDIKPEDDAERILYARLLEIANQASARRDERLALSVKRMPRTLVLFVNLTAITILGLLLFFPFRNAALGTLAVAITTLLLFFAHFVLTDLDNPFEGTWNVSAEPFGELVSKSR
jgi:hypothetical protein